MSDFLSNRIYKGKSLIELPSEFCLVDLETTGLSPTYDSIIEIGALKYSNGVIIDTFQSLARTLDKIPPEITAMTGITNEMSESAPELSEVIKSFDKFLGNNIVMGYNVNFDVNFLYDNYLTHLKKPFTNNFVDLLRFARKLYPELEHHRLDDILEVLNIPSRNIHRGLSDSEAALKCYERFKTEILSRYDDIKNFRREFRKIKFIAGDIQGDEAKNNPDSPLYKKFCVITGKLEKFTRKEVMQIIADLGGYNQDRVTRETNFLILGNNDYCSAIKDGKSSKHKKAEAYRQAGQDIKIIPETVFYDMLDDDDPF